MIYAGISHCSTSTIDWRTIGKTAHFQVPATQRLRVGEKRLDSFHPLIPAVTFKRLRESRCLITSIINSNQTITQTSYSTVLALASVYSLLAHFWINWGLSNNWSREEIIIFALLHDEERMRVYWSWGGLSHGAHCCHKLCCYKQWIHGRFSKRKATKNPLPKTIHKEQVQENEHSELEQLQCWNGNLLIPLCYHLLEYDLLLKDCVLIHISMFWQRHEEVQAEMSLSFNNK